MDSRTLDVTCVEDAKAAISDIKVVGHGNAWQLIGKASSEKQGWMKSTKALEIPSPNSGCVIQVTTQQRGPDGTSAVAEAICFVPGVTVAELKRIGQHG